MATDTTLNTDFYLPDMGRLKRLSNEVVPSVAATRELLSKAGTAYSLEELAVITSTVMSEHGSLIYNDVKSASEKVRRELFGNRVVAMAPVEISNSCASDCLFCGWRVSNRDMKRLKMDAELALLQAEYLIDLGIHYIEFVSGDDISAVRNLLPELIRETRRLFNNRGIDGKISFCTLALTESQYASLKAAGADNTIVWQEAYDPEVFNQHVVGGPKAFGITDDWKVNRSGDGCAFRIQSQERAMRAGLEVGLGSMLGLNPDVTTEFLATVDHARYLASTYGASREHPIIIGMPIWNALTTRQTDLRPPQNINMSGIFPVLAALYLLALPDDGIWVFPNCRVPLPVQVQAAKVAGAFSSTEVKVGPGGYLPAVLRNAESRGRDTSALRARIHSLLKANPGDYQELQKILDEREQFVHHYHQHSAYEQAMAEAGLTLQSAVLIPSP